MGSVAATFGLVIMVMIYATGHISGAHFNPAVTLAFALTRHFPKRETAPYILAQCAGAVVASYVHVASLSSVLAATQPKQVLNLGVTLPVDGSFVTALVWEFMLTFLLMLVIMSMATDFRAVGPAAGLAIGGTVGLEAMFAGPLCGASMNPARSLGPALAAGEWTAFAAYIIGPVLGVCPSNGALRGERRGQRRFEIQMVNFAKFHAAKQHQARLLGEPNPALGS